MRESIYYVILQQENGFEPTIPHRMQRQAKGIALSNFCLYCPD
jgi:hypothetical protein